MIDESDLLRTPEKACCPDSRVLALARVDVRTGLIRQSNLKDQYAVVGSFLLNSTVPEDIAIQFETAKNLYLYAWFVFRFYPVAERQVFATLEFALRERQSEFVAAYSAKRMDREPGLGALLRNAIESGIVRNDAFRAREQWALARAQARYSQEITEKMAAEGLTEMVMDYSRVRPAEEDLNHDWLKDFLDAIPYLRNMHAHGSGVLYHSVLHTFEVVTELTNQLYPEALAINGAV